MNQPISKAMLIALGLCRSQPSLAHLQVTKRVRQVTIDGLLARGLISHALDHNQRPIVRLSESGELVVAAHFESLTWESWPSIVWTPIESPKTFKRTQWAVWYTHNRDSDDIAIHNNRIIGEELEKTDPLQVTWEPYRVNHAAVGWVDGFAYRCFYNNNWHTPALATVRRLKGRLESYPILDEFRFEQQESED